MWLENFKSKFNGKFSTGSSIKSTFSHDESHHKWVEPDIVFFPESEQDVRDVLKFASENKIPVTPYGAGTSIEGNPIPLKRGIVVSFEKMNKIIKVYPDDMMVEVEPGVLYKDLNRDLRIYGLFFPPDPGANASIGGMLANNASGTRTVRYGATKDNVYKCNVALANGDIISVGSLARKSSSGFDLLHLFIGSEGTLGLFTKAFLKLHGIPAEMSAAVAYFDNVDNAVKTVSDIIMSGLNPAALEFMDENVIKMLNENEELNLEEKPCILMEFHGSNRNSLEEEIKSVVEICKDNKATHFDSGVGIDERNRLWEARHKTYEVIIRTNPGWKAIIVDTAVPISKYPELVLYAKEVTKNVKGYIFGHAGDGNLHAVLVADKEDPNSWKKIEEANEKIVDRGIELGGTATGEHGVGIGKIKYLPKEFGEPTVNLMKQIKNSLDPDNILNPGKIFKF